MSKVAESEPRLIKIESRGKTNFTFLNVKESFIGFQKRGKTLTIEKDDGTRIRLNGTEIRSLKSMMERIDKGK